MSEEDYLPDCVAREEPEGLWACECRECKRLQMEHQFEMGGGE